MKDGVCSEALVKVFFESLRKGQARFGRREIESKTGRPFRVGDVPVVTPRGMGSSIVIVNATILEGPTLEVQIANTGNRDFVEPFELEFEVVAMEPSARKERQPGYFWLADSSYLDTEDGHWNVGHFDGRRWQVIGSDESWREEDLPFEIASRIERGAKAREGLFSSRVEDLLAKVSALTNGSLRWLSKGTSQDIVDFVEAVKTYRGVGFCKAFDAEMGGSITLRRSDGDEGEAARDGEFRVSEPVVGSTVELRTAVQLPAAQELFRPDRVILPDHMLTPRMKQATTLPEMAKAWVEDSKELQPAAEKLVDGLLELVHAEPIEGDNEYYDRGEMVARAIALLGPVRGSRVLKVRFENQTDYELECQTEEKDGFLVLRLRRPAGT